MNFMKGISEFREEYLSGHKKGNMAVLQGVLAGVFGLGVLIGVFLLVLGALQNSMTADSAEFNATGQVVTAISDGVGLISPLVIVGFAVAIIGLVGLAMAYLGGRGGR